MKIPEDAVIYESDSPLVSIESSVPLKRDLLTFKVQLSHSNESENNLQTDPTGLWVWMYVAKETSAFSRHAILGGWVSSDAAGQIRYPVDMIVGEVVMPTPIDRQTGYQENYNEATVATEVFWNGVGAGEAYECDWMVMMKHAGWGTHVVRRRY